MSKINETNYPRRPQSDYEDTDMLIIQEAGGNTYTTRIEDIREDCQEAIAPIVEAVNDALAPPENGSTASQSYAIGEHFMRNGDFCTAIAAITSGASFTLNTNYVVGTIAEALESLNSDIADMLTAKAITITGSKGTISSNDSCRIGRLAIMNFTFVASEAISSWSPIAVMTGLAGIYAAKLAVVGVSDMYIMTQQGNGQLYTNKAITNGQTVSVFGVATMVAGS